MLSFVENHIKSKNAGNVFVILDGAAINGFLEKLYQWRPRHVCLFRGKLTPDMAEVAPYLVRLEENHPFSEWVIKNASGRHWGVFFSSMFDERKLRRKFRNMLDASLPDGRTVLFRYYDPRILNAYLPSCEESELTLMFDRVENYFVEDDEQGTLRRHELINGVLICQECG